jgi:outer membrane protein
MFKRLLIIFLFPVLTFSQKDTITLKNCIDFALKNNPQIFMAEGAFEANEANLVSNRAALFPQISFQSVGIKNGGLFISGPISRTGINENYSIGFQASQMIFDFWKTYSKISSSSSFAQASQQDYIGTKQNIVLNTTIAYYNFLLAKRLLDVNNEIIKQSEEHLQQAKAFFNVGRKPQFDVVKAEADLASANLGLIKAKNSIMLNKVQLENVIGTKLKDENGLEDNFEIFQEDNITYEKALQVAIENRPELIGSKARVAANKSLVTSAWAANLPTISATGGYNWKSPELKAQYGESWSLNLTFSLPIFQGGALGAGIDQAAANLKSAEATNDYTEQAIILDVQQQYLSLQESSQRIDVAKKLVTQAEEAFKLAEGRYKSEIGSAIEITDARITLLNARVSLIQAYYDHQVAYARLKRAMGKI